MINSSDILKAGILIVDDQEANVSLLEQMLRGAGYVSVSSTRNPREVCDLHREHRYSLILLDLLMPGFDGFQVMEGLKAIETESYLPVLVQTAQPNHKLRALKGGAKDFISKPFDFVEVLLRVHNLIEVRLLHREAGQRTAELERANRGLEKRNNEIQNFYHTLSHELKTPLTSTREFIALVADGVAGPVNESQAEYLGLALEGCDQLTVCLNDLLDATRLETGKMAIQLKPGSLGQLVKRVLAGLEGAAMEKSISLHEEVAGELPDVLMDDARMSQIITNLVNNALKFTPANGSVRVTVRESASRPELLEVSVSDTGRGIAPEQLELIFDRLYQIKDGDAATEQGVGLGLYLCRELVGLHGGDIRVESELGKGSTFTFTIPEPGALKRPRVLVIEDDPKVSACTRRILEEGGFEALTATTGEEGLRLLEECDPMVVVIDLQMPGLDGADVLKEIRQRFGALPVIIHTGNPEGALMTRALEFSPFTVLAKPCPAERLLETVRLLKGQADTQFWIRRQIEGDAKRQTGTMDTLILNNL
jgi:signal transduction histidine kinase